MRRRASLSLSPHLLVDGQVQLAHDRRHVGGLDGLAELAVGEGEDRDVAVHRRGHEGTAVR